MRDIRHAFYALAMLGAAACAMTGAESANARCTVVNGDKLPAPSGGATALCRAVERGAVTRGLKYDFKVKVSVGKRSMLMADVVLADGRRLPTLHFAEMDRAISRDSLNRLGVAIAEHVAAART